MAKSGLRLLRADQREFYRLAVQDGPCHYSMTCPCKLLCTRLSIKLYSRLHGMNLWGHSDASLSLHRLSCLG
eukprot:5182592-Amphidinium_carterae.1